MRNKLTSILLVDDHSIVRCGIKSLLERNNEFTVCGEASTLQQAYEKVVELKPDIVLLDIKLPDGNGAVGCREIKKLSPITKVIILTAYAEDSIIMETIKADVDGYLLKNIDSKIIINTIKEVSQGASALDPSIVGDVLKILKETNNISDKISYQERKILDLISLGKTNKEIADELYIAEKTVRNNVSKILRKLNVNNRTEAAMLWSKQMSLK